MIKRAQNPLVRIAGRAAADMVKYPSQFGFTPVACARIAAGPFNQPPGSAFSASDKKKAPQAAG
jgi:phage terminase small subunit